ncbi:MAG: hypothetical protein IKU02_07300 [Bacteroidaceae bacterium]|nr:hypothetical protein [Bacteroidaceae bacterium]
MKRLLPILLLLWAVQAFAQELRDSAFWEMEDSVSAMAIKPVEHPEELLQANVHANAPIPQQKASLTRTGQKDSDNTHRALS